MAELVCAASDPAWHAHRATGVTATDITAILGLNRHQSAYGLYWVKRGVVTEQADNDRLALGRALEPYILQRWANAHADIPWPLDGGLYRSSERPWQLATVDAQLRQREPVECKSWADADRHAWDDGPPPAVRAQVLWQMDTLGVSTGHVAVLWLPSGELSTYVIEHDPAVRLGYDVTHTTDATGKLCDLCTDILMMRVAGIEFWERVTEERPPAVDGSVATLAALKQRFPQVTPAQAEIAPGLWSAYEHHAEREKWYREQKKEGEAIIRDLIGEAGEITVDGEVVGRRSRYPVKEHVRKLSWVDKIIRVKNGDDSDA